MSNSSVPPNNPESNNVVAFRRTNQPTNKMRRISDSVHEKVAEIRPDITGRREKSAPEVAKAKPRGRRLDTGRKQQMPEVELPKTIPSIAGGEITEGKKVAAAIDAEYMARSVREAGRVEMIVGSLDFTDGPVSPEDTARALLRLRDEDFEGAFSDIKNTFNDDDDLFIPVARTLLLMFREGSHQRFVDDERVLSLVSIVRDPGTMYQRVLGVLKSWKKLCISGKRVPAVIRGK